MIPRAVHALAMRARPRLDSDSTKKHEGPEGAMHEAREGPEEETREGAADGPPGRKRFKKGAEGSPNRKRRAKGSENTGPAVKDAEGSCGCGKAGGTCDGNCSGKAGAKRGDALTAPEYLAACDLGIQARSRTYIRARLDAAAARQDLKCGKGSISKGEKCSKGAATAPSFNEKRVAQGGFSWGKATKAEKAGAAVGGAATLAGIATAVHGLTKGNFAQAQAGIQIAGAGNIALGGSQIAQGARTGNSQAVAAGSLVAGIGAFNARSGYKAMRSELTSGEFNNRSTPITNTLMRGAALPGNLKGRAKLARNASKRPRGKAKIGPDGKIQSPWLDSVYAAGFTPDMAELAI